MFLYIKRRSNLSGEYFIRLLVVQMQPTYTWYLVWTRQAFLMEFRFANRLSAFASHLMIAFTFQKLFLVQLQERVLHH